MPPISCPRAAAGIDLAGRSGQQGSYYTGGGEKQGVWAAAGSMGVSAGAAVTPEQLTAMLSGIDPGTGNRLGHKIKPGGTFTDRLGIVRNRKPVSAFDLTFSLPKSVSAAWALADGPVRREIEGAWSHSVDAVVAYVQRRGVMSRSGAGGKTIEDVPGGAAIARFDHFTSRAGDPQLHSHLLVANKVLCGDGVWRNLHGQQLYASAKAAQHGGRGGFARRAVPAAGVVVGPHRRPAARGFGRQSQRPDRGLVVAQPRRGP